MLYAKTYMSINNSNSDDNEHLLIASQVPQNPIKWILIISIAGEEEGEAQRIGRKRVNPRFF